MLQIIIVLSVCAGLCIGLDKFDNYGKENKLYVNGYLTKD